MKDDRREKGAQGTRLALTTFFSFFCSVLTSKGNANKIIVVVVVIVVVTHTKNLLTARFVNCLSCCQIPVSFCFMTLSN